MMNNNQELRLATLLGAILFAGAAAGQSDWAYHAGDGDFVPTEQGIELIDTAADARLTWFNPIMNGVGKTNAAGYLGAIDRGAETAFYGHISNLIVADGQVFLTFARPSGEVVGDRDKVDHRYYNPQRMAAMPDDAFRIIADDVTVAMDAATGEVLWTATEPGTSVNFLSDKRGHLGVSGAYGEGMFFNYGLLGHVFAYDATTGEKKWQHTMDAWNKYAMRQRDAMVAERRITEVSKPFEYKRGGLVVADGVLVAPTMRGGLVGLDPRTGRALWEADGVIDDATVPALWRDGERTYLITTADTRNGDGSTIRLIDPRSGEVRWAHETGENPYTPIVGDGHVLLNVRRAPQRGAEADRRLKGAGLPACYTISTEGLTEQWRMTDDPNFYYTYTPDSGRRRRAAIADGVVYIALGRKDAEAGRRIYSFDLASGAHRDVSEQRISGNYALPYIVEDRMFWHLDVGHSTRPAGVAMYRLGDNGRFEPAGSWMFREFDVFMTTGYELPMETPYVDGRFYVRATPGVAAIDVRADRDQPQAKLALTGAWAGAATPVAVRLRIGEDGKVVAGRVTPPAHHELGIVLTTARREDSRQPVRIDQPIELTNEGLRGTVELAMGTFGWPAELDLQRGGRTLRGRWTRRIPALDQPFETRGTLRGKGGFTDRVYPTPWLDHQPITSFGRLADGQQRLMLTFVDALRKPGVGRVDLHVMLDHDGERFVGGVGGAFQYNQAWHEIDATGLTLEGDRLTGELIVIVNADRWVSPNAEAGRSIVGRLTIDARRVGDVERPAIDGTWSATWGEAMTRTGEVEGRLTGEQ